MKISHLLAGSALGTATLAGIAIAQTVASNWPQIELADLEQCRPVIAQVHKVEESYVRKIAVTECNAPARFYSTESCRTARRWLAKTESQDDLVWFFEGNDRCQGTDYPCFGVKIYNTERRGDEARRWARYFMDKSGKAFSVTRGMDLWTAAREADTCVAGVWATKYRTANASPVLPKSEPIQVAEAAPPAAEPPTPTVAEATPVAAPPPPPVEAKAPLSVEAAAPEVLAGTAVAAGAAVAATAAATTAAAATLVKDEPAPAKDEPAAQVQAAVATDQPAAASPPAAATPPPAAIVTAKTQAPSKKTAIKGDAMQQVAALVAEGKTSEAIALGDKFAASLPAGDAQLAACKTRVLAKQDLDRALVACYSTGKPNDPAVLEARGQLHLLAGRHQDAWNDFNAALAAKESNSTLYLRGLALAGMGKTVDALKDLATAEAGEKGIMAAYESRGYTLANVMSGKPLVDAAAMSAAAVDTAAPAAPAATVVAAADPAPAAAAPAATPAADDPVTPLPNSVRPPEPAAAAPVVPLPNAVYPPDTAPPAAANPKPAAPVAAASAPVAAPEPAAAPSEAAPKKAEPASFAAETGSSVAVPGISLPAVTDCLVPVAPGNGGRGAFKNKCNYPVRFSYCNIKGADSAPQLTCGSDTKFRAETIGGNGSAPAFLGLSVAYFACRSPTIPEVIYTSNNGLEGYCR